ncbi:hypothetical protein HNQ59_003239 [Chitinivorax tropicus]|uniref:Uncharacterized protein n=1 Tax=Chitinivorax tropicus TaxID=714531 RepID=A0A840MXP7_9PROT|nr:hypothetical protein [Chitinivorax tropicus]MBB5019931.1 hypothetical protein [Chitinivorax tropicus]
MRHDPIQVVPALVSSLFATSGVLVAAVPADSDFNKDEARRYVHERSAETFSMANQILCYFNQTKYPSFVNKGPYKALVDQKLCNANRDDASNSTNGESTADNSPHYMDWIVDVTRANSTAPQLAKFWVTDIGRADKPGMKILVSMTATESATSTNPYGLFKLDFIGYPLINGQVQTAQPQMKGYIEVAKDGTGAPQLSFFQEELDRQNGQPRTDAAVIQRTADGGAGSGKTLEKDKGFAFAFNSSLFLRSSDSGNACFSRDQTEDTSWRYALYDSVTGARLEVSSGFPIRVTQGSKSYQGWVGYWGLHFPESVVLNHGDTVFKQSFGNNSTTTAYTLLKAGGRLQQHVRKTLTLADMAGVLLDWQTVGGTTRYQIKWEKSQGKFFKVKSMPAQQHSGPPQWTEIDPPVALTSSDLQNEFDLNAWSQALGGSIRIAIKEPDPSKPGGARVKSLSNDSEATIMVQTPVAPGDAVPATLACYERCPDPSKFGQAGQQPYKAFNSGRHDYSFDSTAMVLKEGTTPVVLTAAVDGTRDVRSGALFEPSPGNLAKLACDWNPAETCSWKAWQALDVFYSWQTGVDNWNQLALLKDAQGNVLKFDPPKLVTLAYTNAALGFNETKFQLEYGGFGDLHGIPGDCLDPETNLKAACGPSKRFVPLFSIATGTEVADAAPNSLKTYLVKALETEQRLKKIDLGQCSTLSLPGASMVLPTSARFVTPAIGDEPSVAGGASVVGGVIKAQ